MVWFNDSFPYSDYKGIHFETLSKTADEEESVQIDYCSEIRAYRVTFFKNNHWNGDVVFTEKGV